MNDRSHDFQEIQPTKKLSGLDYALHSIVNDVSYAIGSKRAEIQPEQQIAKTANNHHSFLEIGSVSALYAIEKPLEIQKQADTRSNERYVKLWGKA